MTELRWHYGPTPTDPDPGKMWHYDCGGLVMYIEDGWICCKCEASMDDTIAMTREMEHAITAVSLHWGRCNHAQRQHIEDGGGRSLVEALDVLDALTKETR